MAQNNGYLSKQLFQCSSGLSLQGLEEVRGAPSGGFWDPDICREQDLGPGATGYATGAARARLSFEVAQT